MSDSHLVRLPGTRWHAWRWAIVRSAGFPADGPARLGAPACAEAADAYLGGQASEESFAAAFGTAVAESAAEIRGIAGDQLFRTALFWQNASAARTVSAIHRDGISPRRNSQDRQREEIVGKYWQRYCLKNESIGFFGPFCWVRLEPGGAAISSAHGPSLERSRAVFIERWALTEIASWLAADPRIRPWLPVTRQPHLSVHGRELLAPGRPPRILSAADAALLARCDGRRPASVVASELAGGDGLPFKTADDVHALVEQYVAEGVLRRGPDLPMDLNAEHALLGWIEAIGHPQARAEAVASVTRLLELRDAAAAAGSPDEVASSIAALESEFTAVTGRPAQRRPGEAYAGRTVCHLEAARDLDLTFGGALLGRLAPLESLLLSARWLSATLAASCLDALTAIYRDLAEDSGTPEVRFADLWYLTVGSVLGADSVLEKTVEDFVSRWTAVLGLDTLDPGSRRLTLPAGEVLGAARQAFPADRPGWADARIHSPDILIDAPSVEAIRRGDFRLVLGELHVGIATLDSHFFATGHPAPGEVSASMRADIPGGRVHLLYPDDWPRNSARLGSWLVGPDDVQLGYCPAGGADPGLLLPVTALTVVPGSAGLAVRADDGRSWPLIEMFSQLVAVTAYDAWKLVARAAHTPRVTLDHLVIIRETWRTTAGATGLAAATREQDCFLAARRLRAALDLPDQVFVHVEGEVKPCYADLTSPVYARILCKMLRSATRNVGPGAAVTITEMLPGPGRAWLTDAAGRHYSSELRLHLVDPASAATTLRRTAVPGFGQ